MLKLTKQISFLVMSSALLVACQNYTQEQIITMSDDDVCNLSYSRVLTTETEKYISTEIIYRHLDCNPDHRTCIAYGIQKGTKEYSECRMKLREQDIQIQLKQAELNQQEQMQKKQMQHENELQNNQLRMENQILSQPQQHIMTIYRGN
jgi:hypothetical protein